MTLQLGHRDSPTTVRVALLQTGYCNLAWEVKPEGDSATSTPVSEPEPASDREASAVNDERDAETEPKPKPEPEQER